MADPAGYEVGYSFADWQANNPADPLPGDEVDNELANIQISINEAIAAIGDVRRSDGALKNGIVTLDSLSAALLAGLSDVDEDAIQRIEDAIALIKTDMQAELAAGLATKADLNHTHAANTIAIAPIPGMIATNVQEAILELQAAGAKPGDLKLSLNSDTPPGWIPCNDGTIGDAVSGATYSNDNALALYTVIWNKVSNTWAPVSTGRGVSAAADFAAHKPMALTKMLGRALAIAGTGAGLTARVLGQTLGAETHILTQAELPNVNLTTTIPANTFNHSHTGSTTAVVNAGAVAGSGSAIGAAGSPGAVTVDTVTIPQKSGQWTPLGGSATPLSIEQATAFVHAFLKL